MPLGGTVDVLTTDNPDSISEEQEELQIYEKHNNLLHGSKRKKYGGKRFFFCFFFIGRWGKRNTHDTVVSGRR